MFSLLHLAAVTTIATLGMILFALLVLVRFGPVPNWWPLLALDTFAFYAFIPFLGVALAAPLLRSRTLSVVTLAAGLLFLQQFGAPILTRSGLISPRVASAGEERLRLRILTMNLHAPNDDPTPFIGVIQRVDPDVIMFQEVTGAFERRLQREIGEAYPFSATAGTTSDHEGSGTWSRYPLLEREILRPGPFGNAMHRVLLSTGQGDLWLYNVHLPNPAGDNRETGRLGQLQRFRTDRRDAELQWLVGETATLDRPYVLAGDFNTAAGSYGYRQFASAWQDTFALAGRGFGHTYPAPAHEQSGGGRLVAPFPLLRIDYVLASPGLHPIQAWQEQLMESDHLGLVVDLEY